VASHGQSPNQPDDVPNQAARKRLTRLADLPRRPCSRDESGWKEEDPQDHAGERAGDVLHNIACRQEAGRDGKGRAKRGRQKRQKDGLDDLFPSVASRLRQVRGTDVAACHGPDVLN
jgi:hypothetical protein